MVAVGSGDKQNAVHAAGQRGVVCRCRVRINATHGKSQTRRADVKAHVSFPSFPSYELNKVEELDITLILGEIRERERQKLVFRCSLSPRERCSEPFEAREERCFASNISFGVSSWSDVNAIVQVASRVLNSGCIAHHHDQRKREHSD